MFYINQESLSQMQARKRATLINSLAGYKTAVLVGSKSKNGIENLAIFNSITHIGANPPLFGLIFRPHSVRRDTLENILEIGFYTFNYVAYGDAAMAHQTSAKYEESISEFEKTGFISEYLLDFKAPFVKQSFVKIAMKFEQQILIPINNTILLIGSIQHVFCPDSLVKEDGFVALHEADVLACSGLDAYYKTELLQRLPYAQP
jgi:flavin reductase (DIM6/NTAB) family NADH-FMN oxidoreductase RutF